MDGVRKSTRPRKNPFLKSQYVDKLMEEFDEEEDDGDDWDVSTVVSDRIYGLRHIIGGQIIVGLYSSVIVTEHNSVEVCTALSRWLL